MKTLEKAIGKIAVLIEILLSIIILFAIFVSILSLIRELGMGLAGGKPLSPDNFNAFVAGTFNIVIGVEFVKMLLKRSPGAVIEVLIFAIARQLVVYHSSPLETLVGIVAIVALFAVRKFLFFPSFEDKNGE